MINMGDMFNGASLFDQDLCAWQTKGLARVERFNMFAGTACPTASLDFWCHFRY